MTGPETGRRPLVALALIAVGAVLLVSSVTWFASDRTGVGIAQVVLGLLLGGGGLVLLLRARRR